MSYDTRHCHLTFGGGLFATETWSVGLRIVPSAPIAELVPSQAAMQTFCEAQMDTLVTDVTTFWGGVKDHMNAGAGLAWVKFNAVDELGKQDPALNTCLREFAPIMGTGGFQHPQLAIAISLQTALKRGLASHGRIYMPVGGSLEVEPLDGTISAGDALPLANWMVSFINDVNNWDGVDPLWLPNVGVASRGGLGHVDGNHHRVTGVRIGRAIDTQRRRAVLSGRPPDPRLAARRRSVRARLPHRRRHPGERATSGTPPGDPSPGLPAPAAPAHRGRRPRRSRHPRPRPARCAADARLDSAPRPPGRGARPARPRRAGAGSRP